ncbi:hypothetical protein FIV45_17410 [Paremcibacter congregatus]|nr:hypothetical protein FIV45_17410 [Paremcibacter congregatus]
MAGSGLHLSNIYHWLDKYRANGWAGLLERSPPGRPPKLGALQDTILQKYVVDNSPPTSPLTSPTRLWTRQHIASLVTEKTGISLSITATTRLLARYAVPSGRPRTRIRHLHSGENSARAEDILAELTRLARPQHGKIFLIQLTCIAIVDTKIYCLSATTSKGEIRFSLSSLRMTPSIIKRFFKILLSDESRPIFLIFDTGQIGKIFSDGLLHQIESLFPQVMETTSLTAHPALPKILTAPSEREISDLIAHLHRSILDPLPWYEFLNRLARLLECKASLSVNLHLWYSTILSNIETLDLKNLFAVAEKSWPSHPLRTHLKAPGAIYILSDLYSPADLHHNSYYNEYLQGIQKSQNEIILYISGPLKAPRTISLTRRADQAPFGKVEKDILSRLRPSLEVALETSIRLRQTELSLKALHDAASHLNVATFILDGAGFVINSNSHAMALVTQQRALRLNQDQLICARTEDNKTLSQFIARSIQWRRAPQTRKPVEALRLEVDEDHTLGILVQPIEIIQLEKPAYIVSTNPHVIIHVSDPTKVRANMDQNLISHLFGLSLQESRLTALLATGLSVENAAQSMGVTLTTARTYLQRIYQKLGINRQSDLIQLISNSVASL